MPTHARERLLQAAEGLFYAEGIRAVGVEKLLTASGVGRASFYRHFSGKDDLVVTMLQRYDERWRKQLEEDLGARGGEPLAIFDILAERIERPGYRGCAFINVMVEAADPHSPAHHVAAHHKRAVTDCLAGLLTTAGYRDPEVLAEQFVLLMDGAIVTALRERSAAPARRAKAIASALLA